MAEIVHRHNPSFSILKASTQRVAERWEQQYPADRWTGDKRNIGARLIALPQTATPDDVAEIIGNKSWTHPYCCSCNSYKEFAVAFDNGDNEAIVCAECMKVALASLPTGEPHE